MNDLRIEDFDAFFREMHGPCTECERQGIAARKCEHVEPFAWQRDLARRVYSAGWPSTIELPTASGKTATIDVAVFTLALDPSKSRRAPLRVFFVVDRRVVVDEAHRRASRIATRLSRASSGVAHAVARRLRGLAGEGADPLVTAVLRGGIYREDGWARSPVQPLVAVSTVDQVGSRLLGRGYGVSDGMKPVHQGLVAHDSLIILDEAHLSEPFRETLEALRDYSVQADSPLPRPYRFVVMSATPKPRDAGPQHFRLEPGHPDLADRRPGRLLQRLEARKQTEVRAVDVGKPPAKAAPRSEQRAWSEGLPKRDSTFCSEVARVTRQLLDEVRCVGVVLNRVGTARQVFEQLRGHGSVDAVLLTGRSRPLDREAVTARIWAHARAGRERLGDARALVVVATQCIEAGADLDFDALVTECASLDALRQRCGRLDRLGELGASRAVVIARSDTLDDDPIYGQAIGLTWKWLRNKAKKPRGRRGAETSEKPPLIDFGHAHLPNPTPAELEGLLAPRREAPVLLPAHLDAWATTSPRPAADPDVALWLHGVSDEVADVQIVWRSDLPRERQDLWADIVALCPPGSAEALPVPVYVARAWLAATPGAEVADTVMSIADVEIPRTGEGRRALRWCGEDDPRSDVIGAGDVRPGDTLVVPSAWGGADEYGWLAGGSDAAGPVPDLGDRVQLEQRGRATLRIHGSLSERWVPDTSGSHAALRRLVRYVSNGVEEDGEPPDVDAILAVLSDAEDAAPWLREVARRLRDDPRRRLDAHPAGGIVLRSSRRVPYRSPASLNQPEEASAPEPDFTSQDDASSFVCRPVSLRNHSLGVERLARAFAGACGLDAGLVTDVALSGRLHDVGKADPRFQRWLHGGDEIAAALSELRAKSGMRSRRLRERAREIAGYPKGARHEMLSFAMIAREVDALGARDPDLVLHLVASHHGFCRPFAPVFDEPDDVLAEVDGGVANRALRASTADGARVSRLDSGISERYWSLLRRFGWLGLPYLEAILRLADHRRSEIEEYEEDTR
ncbi:MAG TPA: type I-U CRISPR-associated helicase/endonuclease Cas3 [Anaeromyxobacter sp.]|nr:type I-U CRISPR-associated helicase/endonuclease Cas3 [Anaeromyxobacter sp.]